MKGRAFLRLHPNPFVDEVSVEAMAEGDAGDRSAGLGALLNDLSLEGICSGRFNNVSEVMRAGLRLLEEQQQDFATKTLELKAALTVGMNSGQPRSAEVLFDELEARFQAVTSSKG